MLRQLGCAKHVPLEHFHLRVLHAAQTVLLASIQIQAFVSAAALVDMEVARVYPFALIAWAEAIQQNSVQIHRNPAWNVFLELLQTNPVLLLACCAHRVALQTLLDHQHVLAAALENIR